MKQVFGSRRLLSLCVLLLLSLVAQAQVDLENITDPRQRINYIKRNSKNYFFREARYGEAIAPRDTAVYLVYLDFLLGANERRQQEKDKLEPLSKAQIENMVTELDVNYGSYSRIMIYCNKHKVLPAPKSDQPEIGDEPKPGAGGDTPPPPPGDVACAVDPPLPADVLKTLIDQENYPAFAKLLQDFRQEGTINVLGQVSKSDELNENYIAVFNKDNNKLLVILEPQTDRSFKNVSNGQKATLKQYREVSPNLRLLYFR